MSLVRIEAAGDVAVVTMQRAPANALDPSFIEASLAAIETIEGQSPAAVVLTGSGAFFSGGADLKVVPTLDAEGQLFMARGANALFAGWFGLSRPLVCAINGHAVAGGFVLALCGDVRLSGPNGRFGLTEIKVGIPYPPSAMAVVQEELSPQVARRLVLRGELFGADAMAAFGAFDEVVPADEVVPRAIAVATEMGALPPQTYSVIKHSLRREALARCEDRRSDEALRGWLLDETADASAAVLSRER